MEWLKLNSHLISILESSARHGDKIDDCVGVVALRPVVLDVDVALSLRQLGPIFVHDEREMGKDLESDRKKKYYSIFAN